FGVGRFTFQSKINNVRPGVPDGGLAMESWDEAFGAKVGILLRPISKLRIGLTYQSPEDYKFGFRPHVTGLGPVASRIRQRLGGVKINVPLTEPQQVMASAVYDVLPSWSLMGNVGWQNWTQFGEFPVGISGKNQRTLTANLHFSNTCQIAIGQQLRIGEKWLWSAGFAYDSSPVSRANRNPVLPLDRQLRYGTGIQYEIKPRPNGRRHVGVDGCWSRPLQQYARSRSVGRDTARALLDEPSELRRAQCHLEILVSS